MRITKRRKKEVKAIIKLWRAYFSLRKVADLLNLPYQYVISLLMAAKETYKISDLRKKCHIKRSLSKNISDKLLRVKSLYDELHTLQKVADTLGVTRERVRQLLDKGQKQGLFSYEQFRKTRFAKLANDYDRETITEGIRKHIHPSEICEAFQIRPRDFHKLLKHHKINIQDYYDMARKSKCLKDYSSIVDDLGHHPTTTEMQTRPFWRSVWARIDRYWGNMDNFRKEYGIERPKHRIHSNTQTSFQQMINKRKEKKAIKIGCLINQIKDRGPIGAGKLCSMTGINRQQINNYLKELLLNKVIARQGAGKGIKYSMLEHISQTTLSFD